MKMDGNSWDDLFSAKPTGASPQASHHRQITSALIVDDQSTIRRIVRRGLEEQGIVAVWEAENGLEGLEKYKEHQPDVVFLDFFMPIMEGRETLTAILRENPNAWVIMLTGLKEMEMVQELLNLGAANFISKNASMNDLKTFIAKALEELVTSEGGREDSADGIPFHRLSSIKSGEDVDLNLILKKCVWNETDVLLSCTIQNKTDIPFVRQIRLMLFLMDESGQISSRVSVTPNPENLRRGESTFFENCVIPCQGNKPHHVQYRLIASHQATDAKQVT
ncbi:MAG: response regulator [Magnetococcales bacterium]|nr:response regulator [Magnetococcales bacterium]